MTAAPCTVRVFSRPGCGLCDDVLEQLATLRQSFAFEVATVNVDEDDALRTRHGERVPVVEVNGREIGWGQIPPTVVEQHIAQAAAAR